MFVFGKVLKHYINLQNQYLFRTMSNNFKVGLCQMTATNDKNTNFKIVSDLVQKAKLQKAVMVFLPEGCDFIAKDSTESLSLAETVSDCLLSQYCSLAKNNNIWISLGGFHEKINDSKMYNTHFIVNNEGKIVGKYQKLHLFDVKLEDSELKESKTVSPGTEIHKIVNSPVGQIGLEICYDVRFPELSILLRKAGATILTFPSAFTHETGILHWETLLRARAIENQCYVIASAQIGRHNSNRTSFGQAMIVDPLGHIVAQCSKNDHTDREPEIVFADIDQLLIEQVRKKMPVFEHRRNDVYNLFGIIKNQTEKSNIYKFSNISIPPNTVFFESENSFAFTNIRCVVPGHVLVATKKVVLRLTDLEDMEVADLFQTVIKVQKIMEEAYNCSSSTIVVQDGKDAGQTIPHVHVHILPRKKGDFINNDDIYDALARHDQVNTDISRRTDEEMENEAIMLRQIFVKHN